MLSPIYMIYKSPHYMLSILSSLCLTSCCLAADPNKVLCFCADIQTRWRLSCTQTIALIVQPTN
jgi:hypothetical protein